ncbi:MAG: ATP-binding protein [Methylococcales bacterium]
MALPINIQQLLSGKIIESDRIEYKQGWNPEVILRTICAFANDLHNVGGGYVIVGVEEIDGVAQMPPKGLPVESLDGVQKELLKICHFIQPDYFPVASPEIINGKHILLIWCPPGQHRPYKAPKTLGKASALNKPYYVRRMSSTVEAKAIDEQKLLDYAAHQRTPYDNQVNYHSQLSDLSMIHVTSFLSEIGSDLLKEVPNLPPEDLFRQMRVASGADESIYPLNIGLLMFADKPHEFFRGARIELVQYFDDIGDKFQETFFEGPVWLQLKNALEYIKAQVIKEQIIKKDHKAKAERCYNYPFSAIEEALANAVFHKGYDKQNPIEISIRPDRIEITNFPGPLPPVNKAMLKQKRIVSRDTRNSRLGDFLKDLDLTEGRGTGIRKIINKMLKNGSPEPNFVTDDNNIFFMTELLLHPSFEPVNDTVNDTVNASIAILKPIQKEILRLIAKKTTITIHEMTAQTDKSDSTIKRHIKQLQELGLISRAGSDKAGQWLILKEVK